MERLGQYRRLDESSVTTRIDIIKVECQSIKFCATKIWLWGLRPHWRVALLPAELHF